jgi:hypothetical protein
MEPTDAPPTKKPTQELPQVDIPSEVALKFVTTLEEQGLPADVIARLQTALASIKAPTRRSLTEALFGVEDPDL